MKITKKGYLQVFGIVVIALALVRCIFPSIANKNTSVSDIKGAKDSLQTVNKKGGISSAQIIEGMHLASFYDANGKELHHRIFSVQNFGRAFPDSNSVQLESASRYGVKPVADMLEAEKRKNDLVFVGSNPYYYVDRLHNSIPYLVPRASVLLQDIGRTFFDSLQIKGMRLHKIVVTSVMRSRNDVEVLRGRNGNATQNSCHLYGTTFDVSYNRYKVVCDPSHSEIKPSRNDSLKWILSEVLNDMRKSNRCYIKYEIHQGCFHITVR